MFSFYAVRYTSMANNNDTVTDWYVLRSAEDVTAALDGIDVHPELTEACLVHVFEDGRLATTVDLLDGVPDQVDDVDHVPLDMSGVPLPSLRGTVLPVGHPVVVEDQRLHYGCTTFYN